jgi:hypothetical protein
MINKSARPLLLDAFCIIVILARGLKRKFRQRLIAKDRAAMSMRSMVKEWLLRRGIVIWHRPLDGALAQGDLLFAPKDSPVRADRRYWP